MPVSPLRDRAKAGAQSRVAPAQKRNDLEALSLRESRALCRLV